jgi:hypothetical protein
MLRTLLIAFALAACGGKPAAQAPSNVGDEAKPAEKVAPTGDLCAMQKTCTACLAHATEDSVGSCHWDTGKQACAVACDPGTRNCVMVGSKVMKESDVTEVCANAKPVDP